MNVAVSALTGTAVALSTTETALADGLEFAEPGAAGAQPAPIAADAELIALGQELDGLYGRIFELREILTPLWAEITARRKKLAHEHGDIRDFLRKFAAGDKSFDIMRRVEVETMAEFGLAGIAGEYEAIGDTTRVSASRTFALPARTAAGVAVKARIAAYEHIKLWEYEFDDLEQKSRFLRSAIESTLAAAGQSVPAVVLSNPCPDRWENAEANDEWVFRKADAGIDAGLIALGEKLNEARARARASEADDSWNEANDMEIQIMSMAAHTMAGLQFKARVAWRIVKHEWDMLGSRGLLGSLDTLNLLHSLIEDIQRGAPAA